MKSYNEFFVKLYSWRTTFTIDGIGYHWNARLFRILFTDRKTDAKLPVTSVMESREIRADNLEISHKPITLFLKPSNPRGIKTYRVFVICDKCDREIPAGRIAQHKC